MPLGFFYSLLVAISLRWSSCDVCIPLCLNSMLPQMIKKDIDGESSCHQKHMMLYDVISRRSNAGIPVITVGNGLFTLVQVISNCKDLDMNCFQ